MKLDNSGRVFGALTVLLNTGDSVGGCASKAARDRPLFSSEVGYGIDNDVAVVEREGSRETTLFSIL